MKTSLVVAGLICAVIALCTNGYCKWQPHTVKGPQCNSLTVPLGIVCDPYVNPSVKPVEDPSYYRPAMPSPIWNLKPIISSYLLPTYTGCGYDHWSRFVVADTNPGPKLYKWENYLEPRPAVYAPIMYPVVPTGKVIIPEK